MLSLRSFTRALPRTLSRSSTQLSNRTFASLRQPSQLSKAWSLAAAPNRAAFSTAMPRFEEVKQGSTDQELSIKFQEELDLEKDNSNTEELPPVLKAFLEENQFTVKDVEGDEEVTITRKFGNETIQVTFSIADLNATADHQPDQYSQDNSMYDEEDAALEGQSGGAQGKNTINQGRGKGGNFNVAPEDSVAPADRDELADDEDSTGFPAAISITIEKEGVKGAMNFQAVVHEGNIEIDNVAYYADSKQAVPQSADQEHARRNVYTGPQYGNLDPDLQILLEKYLEERGINTNLAIWIPEFIDFKEQREYMKWLNDAKSFIDA